MHNTKERIARSARHRGFDAEVDLVIVDQSVSLIELLGAKLEPAGYTAEGRSNPESAVALARRRSDNPPDMVLVDLTFPTSDLNGLDVLMSFKKWCPESALIVYTAGMWQEATLLRVAWEAISPASAVSKLSPLETLTEIMGEVMESGQADVDPLLQAALPVHRSPWRSADGYQRLVPHAGHAKLWRVLLKHQDPPPYKVIANESKLSVNTIRNYRDDLLAELRLHGLENPTMQQMHEFVHSIRPLLVPVLTERLGEDR